ncbi:MAG TPA: polysaccharide lyase family protein, partial [Verrucomicrobiae bacterium]|nr:polysaccharide lyase family protein [Verrucomicrobiae bacterium]
TRITIDPKTNGGERGEVSIKGISNGRPMGSGPGGSVIADIEIRYTLARGDSGLYTYCIFTHPTNYAATSVGEARFCAKLNDDIFDWMTVDSNRNMRLITAYDWDHGTVMNFKEARRMNTGICQGQVEHKYDYAANQFDTLAWGWSSSAKHVGIWFINPTTEYLSGGPTKVELSAHRDATFGHNLNAPAPPCLLNYWRSSHYGGSICNIAQGEFWTKVIGPFLIYCDSAPTHNAMWHEALQRSKRESQAWPYNWVEDLDYPHKDQRSTVRGQIVLHDPQAPHLVISNLLVGLSAPDYTAPQIPRRFRGFRRRRSTDGTNTVNGSGREQPARNVSSRIGTNQDNHDEGSQAESISESNQETGNLTTAINATNNPNAGRSAGRRSGFGGFRFFRFGPQKVTWQNDAKHYEFWVRGDALGKFTIPNVRAGQYTLHAMADGVLGEFALSNVTVGAGQNLNLGKLTWQPVRYGKQLWAIGIPNRKASEFFKGNDYYHWGWYLKYPKLFPHDVNYVVGKSDFHKDWFFEQVPHNEEPANTTGRGFGRSTTWSIVFELPKAPHGKATLRLAICGVGTRELGVSVNGQTVGTVSNLFYNATINRDGIGGSWSEHDVAFDASVMKAGKNVMKLSIPGGSLTSGIMYDYLRLALDETASPPEQREP